MKQYSRAMEATPRSFAANIAEVMNRETGTTEGDGGDRTKVAGSVKRSVGHVLRKAGAMDHRVTREVSVVNAEGMHARPVMKFVDLASRFPCDVMVRNLNRNGDELDGKSAMSLMLLDAPQGTRLCITAEGEQAEAAVEALCRLVEGGF